MKVDVSVNKYPAIKDPNADAEEYVGRAYAEMGFPIEVKIARGNNSFVNHLSTVEAEELVSELTQILGMNSREFLLDAVKLGAEYAALDTPNGVERGYIFPSAVRASTRDAEVDPTLVVSYLRAIKEAA